MGPAALAGFSPRSENQRLEIGRTTLPLAAHSQEGFSDLALRVGTRLGLRAPTLADLPEVAFEVDATTLPGFFGRVAGRICVRNVSQSPSKWCVCSPVYCHPRKWGETSSLHRKRRVSWRRLPSRLTAVTRLIHAGRGTTVLA